MHKLIKKRRNPNRIGKRKFLIEQEEIKYWEKEIDSIDYTNSDEEDSHKNDNEKN